MGEQAATTADAAGAAALAEANAAYAARFGHTFIACAAGRGAGELKEDLEARMANPPYAELAVAAAEQMKITERRLRGLVEAAAPPGPAPAAAAPPLGRSPLTTHVLDTSAGRPAAGVPVRLLARPPGAPPAARVWVEVGQRGAVTDGDGRVGDLLPARADGGVEPTAGAYRLEFGMGQRGGESAGGPSTTTTWSPVPAVEFEVAAAAAAAGDANPPRHWHVPLTWAPHGYSTYRGS